MNLEVPNFYEPVFDAQLQSEARAFLVGARMLWNTAGIEAAAQVYDLELSAAANVLIVRAGLDLLPTTILDDFAAGAVPRPDVQAFIDEWIEDWRGAFSVDGPRRYATVQVNNLRLWLVQPPVLYARFEGDTGVEHVYLSRRRSEFRELYIDFTVHNGRDGFRHFAAVKRD